MLLHTQALLHTDSTHDPHTARPSADQPADQRMSGSEQRISGSVDEGARGSADQPADRRISGSAQRISASADQSLLDQRSPRIAEPADLQISGSLGGSADQSLDESAEPADQRISGSLGGSAAPADQRIRESQRLGQCRLDRKSFPQRTCPIIGVSFGPASQASSSSSRSLQELGVAEDRVCQVS